MARRLRESTTFPTGHGNVSQPNVRSSRSRRNRRTPAHHVSAYDVDVTGDLRRDMTSTRRATADRDDRRTCGETAAKAAARALGTAFSMKSSTVRPDRTSHSKHGRRPCLRPSPDIRARYLAFPSCAGAVPVARLSPERHRRGGGELSSAPITSAPVSLRALARDGVNSSMWRPPAAPASIPPRDSPAPRVGLLASASSRGSRPCGPRGSGVHRRTHRADHRFGFVVEPLPFRRKWRFALRRRSVAICGPSAALAIAAVIPAERQDRAQHAFSP